MNGTQLIDLITQRLDKKTKSAEDAFVRSQTCKCTENCKNAGRQLGTGIQACKVQASGTHEQEATLCHDRKAVTCTLFVPKLSPEDARRKFRGMSETDLALRWPSIGELLRILRMAREQDANPDE